MGMIIMWNPFLDGNPLLSIVRRLSLLNLSTKCDLLYEDQWRVNSVDQVVSNQGDSC